MSSISVLRDNEAVMANMVKIAVHSAKGCCTATTMALTSIKQKDLIRLSMNNSYDNGCFHAGGFHLSQTIV